MKNLKTYLFLLLMSIGVTLPMCSCKRVLQKIDNLTAKTSEVETEQTDEVTEPEQAKGPIILTSRTYEGESFFKANIQRALYADQTWHVQWPVSAENCNIEKFQKELLHFFVGDKYDDIDSFLNYLNKEFEGDGEWKKVDKMGESDARYIEGEEYNPYPQSMNYELSEVSLTEDGYATYSKKIMYDMGSGLGAGVLFTVEYFMYDLRSDRRLLYNDIFAAGSEGPIAKLLKTKATNLDDYRTLIDADFPPVHNDNFYVDFKNEEAHFVYDKYEVAAGADGVVDLCIPFSEIKQYMK